jgi:DNA-binding CsgD family transcriptional regulator
MNLTLSPREYEVARLFALGRTWLEVMAEMHIGRETVSKHRRNAMERADVGSMPELWTRLGWLEVPSMGTPSVDVGDESCAGSTSKRRSQLSAA